jgi:hypothetical protein
LNIRPGHRCKRSIQGQLLRLSERREVAIFLRDGALWVADFVDGQGALIDAITWFRFFNCGARSTPHAQRRMVLESATPLSEELVARIERLHRPDTAERGPAVVRLVEAIAARLLQSRLAAIVAYRIRRRRVRVFDSATRTTTDNSST